VAQGVPFAREYGGLLANRSFGGAQVSRTFYARGQTGQQLLLGAYSALSRQIGAGKVRCSPPEMLDMVIVNGRARGIVVRNLITGEMERYAADAVSWPPAATATFSSCPPTPSSNVGAAFKAYKKGALRQPLLHPDSPHLHPGSRRPTSPN
jgi:succinate dehydrogenase / fumarate reductase flavoprotein subunit